ncbi:MAG: ATP-binding cassette domain-containing protein [Chitinivibrionia bacterium]|nr:ATP-binding cassette domain-containing protein [Chitinivibrionia bacterium]
MIEVTNLSKYFAGRPAVLDVTFSAEKGEILGFLGPNGAGKTTTMRILTCFLPPSSGSARIAGYDILEDSIEVRKRIGYMPEHVALYNDLSVAGYLDFVGRLKGMAASARSRRTGEVMEECGVFDVKDRLIGKLSRGYRQRVGIAQALLNDPEVLILDEPTVGLDPKQIIEIRELIRELSGSRTIVLSTHILPEVSLLCQRVIIINKGRVITYDTPENLQSHFRRSMVFTIELRGGAEPAARLLSSIDGLKSVVPLDAPAEGRIKFRIESHEERDVRELIARQAVENGFGLLGLSTIDMSLEDIFVQLVTEEEQ